MIDSNSTSPDWQTHLSRIAVCGVGAHEQHGTHLPLDTDNIVAGHFARRLAGELDAALLPTLRIATSLEHAAFRGSLTLRPETLMAVVRDLAAELESQGFTRWILVNGHGGNFALTPVARDINRSDHRLKILLCNVWDHCDPSIATESHPRGLDIHAGEWETSLMLALAPELVRPGGVDMPIVAAPLRQADLTTFGIGHFAPAGAIGWPSLASAAKGRAIVESTQAGLLAHVRARLARLDAHAAYSGAGGIGIRPLVEADVPAAATLSALAGWNQTEDDWRLLLGGGLAAVRNGALVATAVASRYEDGLGWLSMMLVDPAWRGLGIASTLIERALARLAGCRCVMLDSTAQGERLYERAGFAACGRLTRLAATTAPAAGAMREGVSLLSGDDLAAAGRLDAEAFGGRRPRVLAGLLAAAPELAFKAGESGSPRAFCLGRPGVRGHHIGPVVASRLEDAQSVIAASLAALRGRPVIVDAVDPALMEWLKGLGFAASRGYVRMALGGRACAPERPERYYAAAGPELG